MAYTIKVDGQEQKQQEGNGENAGNLEIQSKELLPTMSWVDFRRIMTGADPNRPNMIYDENKGIYVASTAGSGKTATIISNKQTGSIESKEFNQFIANNAESIAKLNAVYTKQFASIGSPDDVILNSYAALPFYFTEAVARGAAQTVTGLANAVYQLPGIARQNAAYANFEEFALNTPLSVREEARDALVRRKALTSDEPLNNRDVLILDPETLTDENGKPISQQAKDLIYEYKKLAVENENVTANANFVNDVQRGIENFEDGSNLVNTFFGDVMGIQAAKEWRPFVEEDTTKKIGVFAGNVVGSVYGYGAIGALTRATTTGFARGAIALGAKGLASAMTAGTGAATTAAIFGTSFVQQYTDIRNLALSQGKSISEANAIALWAGTWEGGVEAFMGAKYVSRFLSTDRSFINVLYYTLSEGMEEVTQTAGENFITQMTGLTDKQFNEIASEILVSFIGGVIGAGIYSAGDMFGAQDYARAEARRYRDEKAMLEQQKIDAQKAIEADRNANKIELKPQQQTPEQQAQNRQQFLEWQRKRLEETKEDFKKEYYRKSKAATNNKVTEKELEDGWKAVENMLLKESIDGEFSNKAYMAINQVVSGLEAVNASREQTSQVLKSKGISTVSAETILNRIYDEDTRKNFNKDIKFVSDDIYASYRASGATEKDAKLASKVITGALTNTFLLANKSTMEVWQALKPKMANALYANMNGQLSIPLVDNIKKVTNPKGVRDINSIKELVTNISSASQGNKRALATATKILYGDEKMSQEDFMSLMSILERQGNAIAYMMQGDPIRGIDGLGWDIGNNLDRTDYITMALMLRQGYTFSQIADTYGLKINDRAERDIDLEFNNKQKEMFPALSEDDLFDLQTILSTSGFEEIDTSEFEAQTADLGVESSSLEDYLKGSNIAAPIEQAQETTPVQEEPRGRRTEDSFNRELDKVIDEKLGPVDKTVEPLPEVPYKEAGEILKSMNNIDNSRTAEKKISDKSKLNKDTEKVIKQKAKKVEEAKKDMLSNNRNFGQFRLETNITESEDTEYGESDIIEDVEGNRSLKQNKKVVKQQVRETKITDANGNAGIRVNGSDLLSSVFGNNMNAVDTNGKPLGKVLYKQNSKILSVKQTTRDGNQSSEFTFEDSKGKIHTVSLGTNLESFIKFMKNSAKSRGKQTLFSKDQEKNKIFSTHGMYDPETNMMVFFDAAPGTALHEGVHFLFSGTMFNNLKALGENRAMSVLPGVKTINDIATTIMDSLPKTIRTDIKDANSKKQKVDYTIAQETMVEAVFDYLMNHSTGSAELDSMFNSIRDEIEDIIQNPSQSIYKRLSKTARNRLSQDIKNIFKPSASLDMLADVSAIEDTLFNAPYQQLLDNMVILLDKYAIPNKDVYLATLSTGLDYASFNNLSRKIINDIKLQAFNIALTNSQELSEQGAQNLVVDPYAQNTLFSSSATLNDYETAAKNAIGNTIQDLADMGQRIMQEAGVTFSKQGAKKVCSMIANALDKKSASRYIMSLSDIAAKVSPRMKAEMEAQEFDRANATKAAQKPSNECAEVVKKLRYKDKVNFIIELNSFMLNPNKFDLKDRVIDKYITDEKGFTQADRDLLKSKTTEMRDTLRHIYAQLRLKGVSVGYIDNYFPRILSSDKALEKIREYYKETSKGPLDELTDEALKSGLTTQGEINMYLDGINGFLRGGRGVVENNTDAATLSHKRRLQEVVPEIADCFLDPFTAYNRYVEFAYRTIMMRNMFGDQISLDDAMDEDRMSNMLKRIEDNADNIVKEDEKVSIKGVGTIGRILATELVSLKSKQKLAEDKKDLAARDEFIKIKNDFDKNFKEYLLGLTGYLNRTRSPKSKTLQSIRSAATMFALGTFPAALSNFKENIITAFFYGFGNTIKENLNMVKGKQQIDIEDFAITGLSEILQTGVETGMKDLANFYMRWSMFSAADKQSKQTTLNVIADSVRQSFKKDDKGNYDLGKEFDSKGNYNLREKYLRNNARNAFINLGRERFAGALDALNAGVLTGQQGEDAKYLLFSLFSMQQPINSISCACNYNSMGDVGKMCLYGLRTVCIKQISALINYGKFAIKEGNWKDWLKELLRLTVCAIGFGVPVDIMKDIARLRLPDLSSSALYAMPDLFMFNEYRLSTLRDKSIGAAAAEFFMPPFNTFAISRGRWLRLVPGVGPSFYSLYSMLSRSGNSRSVHTADVLFSRDEQKVASKNAVFD